MAFIMPDPELLAERVSTVVRRRVDPAWPDGITRNRLTVLLAANGDLRPEMVDTGIERALQKGLIEEGQEGFVPARE